MEIVELTQDLKAKDELIEDLIHDAHDSISISNDSEVKKYNDFLDGIEETCRQMREIRRENIKEVLINKVKEIKEIVSKEYPEVYHISGFYINGNINIWGYEEGTDKAVFDFTEIRKEGE